MGHTLKTKKAVITAAGTGQRNLPLQSLIDSDGTEKSVLSILIEDTLNAGVEEIGLVINPEDEKSYREEASKFINRLVFIHQNEPLGYGHAIMCAKDFVGNSSFLHMVGDHLNVSLSEKGCSQRLIEIAEVEKCTVSAVQATHESQLTYYGTVGADRVSGTPDQYKVNKVVEKPTPTEAEQSLFVPGLRSSHYLCFFGIHVLTNTIFSILEKLINDSDSEHKVTLSEALNELAKKEKYLAYEHPGWRYDLGEKYGLFTSQLALAMNGKDKNVVLSKILEILAVREIK